MKVISEVRGYFSRDVEPVARVVPGERVRFETLDAGWGSFASPQPFPGRRAEDNGHALTGPVWIEGAEPGMTLAISLHEITPGPWGWSSGPGVPSQIDSRLGLGESASGPPQRVAVPPEGAATFWKLADGFGTAGKWRLRLAPFLGVMGVAQDVEGPQSTFPPGVHGGNMDCKELVAGTTLFLPIFVPGALFSCGDGHAVQGNGEMAGPALACPMSSLLSFEVLPQTLTLPRAKTPEGWFTFGFHSDVNEAWFLATQEMVQLMTELHPLTPKEALGLSSLVVDLSLTQVVNGVRGVHAFLPHAALQYSGTG